MYSLHSAGIWVVIRSTRRTLSWLISPHQLPKDRQLFQILSAPGPESLLLARSLESSPQVELDQFYQAQPSSLNFPVSQADKFLTATEVVHLLRQLPPPPVAGAVQAGAAPCSSPLQLVSALCAVVVAPATKPVHTLTSSFRAALQTGRIALKTFSPWTYRNSFCKHIMRFLRISVSCQCT